MDFPGRSDEPKTKRSGRVIPRYELRDLIDRLIVSLPFNCAAIKPRVLAHRLGARKVDRGLYEREAKRGETPRSAPRERRKA